MANLKKKKSASQLISKLALKWIFWYHIHEHSEFGSIQVNYLGIYGQTYFFCNLYQRNS